MSSPGSTASLRSANQQRVVDVLRAGGTVTQADIARQTGLAPATVSNIVRELAGAGLVSTEPGSGRRGSSVELARTAGLVAGIDFGHSHVAVAVGDLTGQLIDEKRRRIDSGHPYADGLATANAILDSLLAANELERSDVRTLGLGLPAPMTDGVVRTSAILPGWVGVNAQDAAQEALGAVVHIENDANLGALAEHRQGVGRGHDTSFFVKISSGVGAGIIINDQLFHGAGGTAGEIGHLTLDEQRPALPMWQPRLPGGLHLHRRPPGDDGPASSRGPASTTSSRRRARATSRRSGRSRTPGCTSGGRWPASSTCSIPRSSWSVATSPAPASCSSSRPASGCAVTPSMPLRPRRWSPPSSASAPRSWARCSSRRSAQSSSPTESATTVAGMVSLDVSAPPVARSEEILTPEALAFVADLDARFHERRDELLAARVTRRDEIARTGTLDFLPQTSAIRDGEWTVAPIPGDLLDRRVEITGPTDTKMAINALNSGAKVWLADLEDANTPHWRNVVGGQITLRDAVRRQLAFTSPEGKAYALEDPDNLPVIVPRPRGWHFDEEHLTADGRPVVAALVDFGLFFFHNAREQLSRGSGAYFYLPKMESHLEARLWNDVFTHAEAALEIPTGTIRATVLIETITAAFEMDEIIYELRDHMAGLNAGRWDYLFSIIKNFRDAGPAFTLPDRGAVAMTAPMMQAYSDLLVRTCHRRGAFAIGGMAAFIPSRKDAEANERAFAKVREDKTREATAGFDGSWVAHPDLVPLCAEIFGETLGDRSNQLDVRRDDVAVEAADLLAVDRTPGDRTEAGLRGNVRVGIQYIQAWLSGNGAAGIDNLMEDAATAEISRSQVWQWINNAATLDTGEVITRELVERIVEEEHAALGDGEHLDDARRLFVGSALAEDFPDFLTLPAYAVVLAAGG